jgi:hypothetical protein
MRKTWVTSRAAAEDGENVYFAPTQNNLLFVRMKA